MRVVAVGFRDLLDIEKVIANLTYKVFQNIHEAQIAIKQLDLFFSPVEGEKKYFEAMVVGKDAEYNPIFNAGGVRTKLPQGMSIEDMGKVILYRIAQILIPSGWNWTEFVPDGEGGLTTFDR